MDLVQRECARSLSRGLGPPRQSAEISLREVVRLNLDVEPLCSSGPINPGCMFVLGSYFLLREIELSLALVANFQVVEGPVVIWKLPASKTDPEAISVTREWGCLCSRNSTSPCPAHFALRHLELLRDRFCVDGRLPIDLPVFPTLAGEPCSKEAVVRTFEALGSRCGLPVRDPLGRRSFGGHSARVSGARWLANMGLELLKIAVLARWASTVIVRYVSDAPLCTITSDCRKLAAGSDLDSVVDELRREVEDGKRQLADLDSLLRRAVSESRLRIPESIPCSGRFVLNRLSGVWHRFSRFDGSDESEHCRSICGWRFRRVAVAWADDLQALPTPGLLCERCLPQASNPDPDASDVVSSDSSSSESSA